jgi:hypothetical protein
MWVVEYSLEELTLAKEIDVKVGIFCAMDGQLPNPSLIFLRSVIESSFCLPALTLTARTAVTIFFTSNTNLFLRVVLFSRREVGGERRVVTFPSGALLFWREIDLTLSMGFSCCFNGVAPVRRREDAEGNRDSGVKVQVDDLSGRELFSNAFRLAERKTRRDLLLLGEEGEREESVGRRLSLISTSNEMKRGVGSKYL